ncbi:DUF3144 domain-containing protein [Teredinibacter turnerae]|uniref:DUF3144 domain-containing protein n=1 Tax=Teredinibacter turnerae (strain ATCC 39867 / T7901) TaxID=377629 RepID=C5BT19_TERTT|nr:DUF3144 domain-containing protein [Teredinibacter turnerae]ACR11649.1 conserved hypothetical protein [Teredinibacter turnerae T7901]
MSELSPEETQFWDAVDAFIDTANREADNTDPGIISSAILYAAARFSAFYVASFAESRKDFIEDSEETIRHYSEEFLKLMQENIADYGENFKVYMREDEEPQA